MVGPVKGLPGRSQPEIHLCSFQLRLAPSVKLSGTEMQNSALISIQETALYIFSEENITLKVASQ